MKNPTCTGLITKLRLLRVLCGYSQEVVGLALHKSQSAISKVESGKSVVSYTFVIEAAAFYLLTLEELTHEDIRMLSMKVIDRQYAIRANQRLNPI